MGQADAIKFLVERGADVQSRTPNGLTALHGAAAKGQRDVLELLVQLGADVGAGDLQVRVECLRTSSPCTARVQVRTRAEYRCPYPVDSNPDPGARSISTRKTLRYPLITCRVELYTSSSGSG